MTKFKKGHKINVGRKHTEETKDKMSLAKLGIKNALGHKHSKETRLKISQALKGRKAWNKNVHMVKKPSARSTYTMRAREILEKHYGIPWDLMTKPKESIIHHINGDFRDNKFENLCVMSREEHSQYHRLGNI